MLRIVRKICSRMFQPGFVEQENKEVVLKDFDADTLSVLLNYMYTATITITEETVQDVLIGANLLLLHEVREAAGEVLGKLIDNDNVLHIKSLASTFSCREVEFRAHNFLLERFEIVSKSEEFLKLNHTEVGRYLEMDDVIVKSEDSIFECILRWINFEKDSRSQHFDSLVRHVRFPLLSDHYIKTVVKTNPLMLACNQADIWLRTVDITKGEGTSYQIQYRGSNQLLFIQSANLSSWLKNPPVLYDFKKNKWKTVKGPSGVCRYREGSCFVFQDGFVYSLGGEYLSEIDRDHPHQPQGWVAANIQQEAEREIVLDNQVYSFTLEENSWQEHSYMVSKRKRHQAVILNGKIFAIGGTNELSRTLDSVEMLNLSMGSLEWEEGKPMMNKRVSHGAVVINGCIYVVGGWNGQGVVKSVEMFHPEKDSWSEVSRYDGIRMKSGVAAMDGKIYVVGGCLQTLESCYRAEVFDPVTLQWRQLTDSHHARASPILVPYRGKLYVFGGEGNSQGVVECYDPHTEEWSVLDTRIKHHVNGPYVGCLVDKPWDWDIQQSRECGSVPDMQRILSGVGLDVVQTVRSLGVFDSL